MTAEPVGGLMWSPNPFKRKFARYTVEDVLVPSSSFGHQKIRLPVRDIAP
jgi:hypothetical protein